MSLYRPLEAAPGTLRFKIFHLGAPVTLSDSLPMLEHMGLRVLDEHPHRITPQGMQPVWMHDFGMQTAAARHRDRGRHAAPGVRGRVRPHLPRRGRERRLQPAGRRRAHAGGRDRRAARLCEVHAPDRLSAVAGVHRGARSPRTPTSRACWSSCSRRASIPTHGAGAGSRAAEQERAIEATLEHVDNLSEDRVLRQYLALILATTRTNFWRRDAAGNRRSFLSFKFDPAKVPGLPEPKPMFEIFVYSTRFEGVHLRGGTRRARRAALVGPAGGLPHRGAGARQGADGEEHGDRAGRLARAASC